ncbi:Outer membrane flp protein [Pantoea agglomerans]|uniref:Long-chain fatty acid transport protein n=1 Tax=Enterobacter agglomerans TaxID=549 RepID=A0A379ADT6_ENTAG|nr:Outer membrane flp protein [Pantoea agglomerans]
MNILVQASVFDAVYAKAKIERYAGESGARLGVPADTQVAHLKGDEWGYGWNAGILYEVDENNRFGFTYRSEVKVDFDGDYKSNLSSRLNAVNNPEVSGVPFGTNGTTVPGALTLNLPEMWEVSGWHKVAPAVGGSLQHGLHQLEPVPGAESHWL